MHIDTGAAGNAAVAAMREAVLGRRAGRSSVVFANGAAIIGETEKLRTVGVVVVGLDSEVAADVYGYLYRVQILTQGVRFFIVTDGSDLRAIRRFGWLTEHVMARESYEELEPNADWLSMVSEQIVAVCDRLDAAGSVIVGHGGITEEGHLALMSLLRMNIPHNRIVNVSP